MAPVNTIAVIGAGIMGRGIAHVAALGGYRTLLEDVQAGIEADQINKFKRPHGMIEPELQGFIDVSS